MKRLVREIYRELAKKVLLAISLMVNGSLEDFLISEKLDFVSHSKMENAISPPVSVNMHMGKLKSES